jgi:predicted Zn-dependent protease
MRLLLRSLAIRALLPLLALLPLAASACHTVEYTGRTGLILLSESQENSMGEEAYAEITGKAKLSDDPHWTAVVDRVGKKIAAVSNKPDFAWEFKLIDDPKTVNAFCLPGGKVAFYSGILPVCKDEAGVAVVMGHEVAHAVARHGGERVSQQLVLQLGAAIVVAAFQKKDEGTQEAVLALYGIGTAVAFALPFSRKHESEADYIGLLLMAKAGYDPREAPRFWERMSAGGGQQPPEWISTHPSHETRIADLESRVPEAMQLYQEATGIDADYHKRTLRSD